MTSGVKDMGDFAGNGGQFVGRGERTAAPPGSRSNGTGNATPLITWRSTSELFEPLPPPNFLVPGLHLGPGRPAMINGYGSSAKSLAAQDIALAVASGTPVWDHFATSRFGKVRHFDYEQGFAATARRYQRLALGRGLDRVRLADRLQLAVFPPVYLDSPDAADVFARECDGVDLSLVDALRGATPTCDENDSSIRAFIDVMSRVSEKTGTTFVLLHHAGKPKDTHSDRRTAPRGSSAIFDGCGCVLLITNGKGAGGPRKVEQTKPPADAEGASLDEFAIEVEDVAVGDNPSAGVRVVWRPAGADAVNPVVEADARFEADAYQLLEVVRSNQGKSQNVIITKSGIGRTRASQVLNTLEEQDRVRVLPGERGAKTYRTWAP